MSNSLVRRKTSYPLVSVVIPSFNHEKYVARCLQSLLEDGYPNLELLLMDDGSSDNTYLLSRAWLEENGRCFRSVYSGVQENRGVVKTLNHLIRMASGEFIVLLASDDYLLPDGIEARLLVLMEHPEWLAIIGDCIVVDENGALMFESGIAELRGGDKRRLLDPKQIRTELILRWSIPGPVLLLRREAFDPTLGVGRYDESIGVEDRDYYLRLLAKNALGFIDTKVSAYRVHSTNFSSRDAQGNSRAAMLYELGTSSRKNMKLFSGMDRIVLFLQSLAYDSLAAYAKSGRLSVKVVSSLLWRTLNFLYFAFAITSKIASCKK